MTFDVQFKPRAVKDLGRLPRHAQSRILSHIEAMSDGLKGDVKRLTDHTPEYRLRVGDYRVLFEIDESTLIIYRILHRREAYR